VRHRLAKKESILGKMLKALLVLIVCMALALFGLALGFAFSLRLF
jgi:hypothetical protein